MPVRLAVLALSLAAPAAALAGEPLLVSDQGVGALTASTPFTRAGLAAAFPAQVVTASEVASEGEAAPAFLIGPPEHPVATVVGEGARITAVAVHRGDRVGRRFSDLLVDPASCAPGLEEASGTVVCPLPGSAAVVLRFSGAYEGPDGTLPPPSVLEAWTVDQVIWRPSP